MEKATFGAGCFWGVQVAFDRIPGVEQTAVGYEGGALENPTYREVCTDSTGHAEVLEITFDPAKVAYQKLLDVFFGVHDPTQLNRQGPDMGTQYRSVIFYHSDEQRLAAEATIERLTAEHKFSRAIATQVVPAKTFWPAEEYHQKYLEKRGTASCHI
ncbi:MAG: peptide-methionine (S)-S-oxide reductase MsrA [Ktedonobacteraceae bacterium]|nr:peptide-methionine (S)-S-oxide reductase MsrA [Ktedonobacteraceae bacterium]